MTLKAYLLNFFLSGLSFKYESASTCAMWAAIDDGLEAPHGSDGSEVLVGLEAEGS